MENEKLWYALQRDEKMIGEQDAGTEKKLSRRCSTAMAITN